jgi:hypothetical protein
VEVRDHLRALSANAEDHFSHEEWRLQSPRIRLTAGIASNTTRFGAA